MKTKHQSARQWAGSLVVASLLATVSIPMVAIRADATPTTISASDASTAVKATVTSNEDGTKTLKVTLPADTVDGTTKGTNYSVSQGTTASKDTVDSGKVTTLNNGKIKFNVELDDTALANTGEPITIQITNSKGKEVGKVTGLTLQDLLDVAKGKSDVTTTSSSTNTSMVVTSASASSIKSSSNSSATSTSKSSATPATAVSTTDSASATSSTAKSTASSVTSSAKSGVNSTSSNASASSNANKASSSANSVSGTDSVASSATSASSSANSGSGNAAATSSSTNPASGSTSTTQQADQALPQTSNDKSKLPAEVGLGLAGVLAGLGLTRLLEKRQAK